ncbi:MAG: tetratricopeptide repeat protein [Saprospiraceae bacterium]|nr:tetratricopeptide repeat protein [Saprospiraceae bacterium]
MNESFIDKLKKRRIWRTFVAYPAASFVILQAVDFFISKYGLNPRALTFTLVLLCGGFVVALIWNWLHGEEGHQDFTKKEVGAYVIISLITLIAAVTISGKDITRDTALSNINVEKAYRLAVLPFNSAAGDASMDYLSEGIPENLINRLAQNTNFQLVSRASSFILDANLRNAAGVLEHLKANLMLTGKIDRVDKSLIVNCQLIDTETNTQIWGDKVAYTSDDILEIEEQMVTSLISTIPEKFKKQKAVSKSWSDIPEAQSHYMKGRALSYGSTAEETKLALDHFREAVKLDPNFVAAYVAIASEQQVQAMFATDTRADIFNEARLAVQTALNLDPNYGEAHTVDAMIKFYQDRDWEAAETAYKKAIQLDDNNATALIRYTFFLTTFRRYDEALEMAERAVVIDPISISSLHNLGWANLLAGNYPEAEKAFSDAIEIHPNWIWGYVKRGYSRIFQGKCDLVIEDYEKARQLIGDWGSELLESCLIYLLDQCNYQELEEKATRRYFERVNRYNYNDAIAMSFVYGSNENYEESIQWMQNAVDDETTAFYVFTLDYAYDDEILDDPRFKQMKRDLNLPQ